MGVRPRALPRCRPHARYGGLPRSRSVIAWRTVLWVVLHVHSRPWVVSGGVTAGAGQLRSAPSMYFSCRWNVIPVWLSVHFVANLGMCIDVTCHTVLRGGSAQDRNVWGRGRAERSHESPNAALGMALRRSGEHAQHSSSVIRRTMHQAANGPSMRHNQSSNGDALNGARPFDCVR